MTSNRADVLITDYVENPDIEREVLGGNVTLSAHSDVKVLLVWHQRIDQNYAEQFPNLKGVVRYGVGFDNIDLEWTRAQRLYVCNTPDYGTDEVSDTSLAMILNIARGVSRYDRMCRGYSDRWQENIIPSLQRTSQMTLGIIGAGRIGGSVAMKAKHLRFDTVIFDPYRDRGYEKMLGVRRVDSLGDLLEQSDIVSFNAPLSDETRGMINTNFVELMKEGASFVNTARGCVISDLDVFYEPLKTGKLSCVALDVLPVEPPIFGRLVTAWRSREDWLDGRLVINPHTAYFSQQAYQEMREKAAQNAKRILDGFPPYNLLYSIA